MTPNLFVLGKTVLSPHRWFDQKKKPTSSSASSSADDDSKIQHWEQPVPGYYEHEEGRGWYLIAKDGASLGSIKVPRTKVTYSKVLKRWIYEDDMAARKLRGRFLDERISREQVGFFRLDDGVAWVNSSDATGNFLPGPYTLYCIDADTKKFRAMKKRDDPIRQQTKRLRDAQKGRQSSSSSGDSDDVAPKFRKESNALAAHSNSNSSRPASSRTYTNSRTPSVEPRRNSKIETLPLSTCRLPLVSD